MELNALIEKTFPLPSRFRAKLPANIAELSRLLTSARPERGALYLSQPALLSAYLRYFLPWNVYRLGLLFESAALPEIPFGLQDGDAIDDLGSGPLTFPIALWLGFPKLRPLKLEFRCIDRSAPALEAGAKLFAALAEPGGKTAWNIKPIRANIDAPVRGGKAKLVAAANAFNEAKNCAPEKAAALLARLCAEGGSILACEPGVPQAGAFIAALKNALVQGGFSIAAPCVSDAPCPLALRRDFHADFHKGKTKWCHFARETDDAPAPLRKLSEAAGLPKERAAWSYLYARRAGEKSSGRCGAAEQNAQDSLGTNAPRRGGERKTAAPFEAGGEASPLKIRIVSDPFPVKGGWGRYACCGNGLGLVRGARREIEARKSGSLCAARAAGETDEKSGAVLFLLSDILLTDN